VSLSYANPVEHAMVLIDVCGGLESAYEQAAANCEEAMTAKSAVYWLHVAQALTPPLANA
jgi:hypothetical protein